MKKILVTGSNGLLGQKLTDLIVSGDKFELIATSTGSNRHPLKQGYEYEELDIRDPERWQELIAKHHPDVIIHTAAMTNVDKCESEQELCRELNVDAVALITSLCEQYNIHLIHLSTDFIFDGEDGPYKEDAAPNPVSYYGQSKLDAEEIIQKTGAKWSILRTIIVYGIVNDMSRSNIVLWAKSALEKGSPINVVDDQWRMPTLAEDLAICCLLAAEKGATGVFNASGKDMMSIIELVERVAAFWQLDASLIRPISSDSLNQAARRPKRTGFDLSKSREILGYKPRSFEEGMEVLKEQLQNN